MYDHFRKIINFVPFKKKNTTEVSVHFNLKFHHINDFKVCIFKTDLGDSIFRKSAEMDLVNFLNLFCLFYLILTAAFRPCIRMVVMTVLS